MCINLGIPAHWQSPFDTNQQFKLKEGAPEYETVKKDFMKTMGDEGWTVKEVKFALREFSLLVTMSQLLNRQ